MSKLSLLSVVALLFLVAAPVLAQTQEREDPLFESWLELQGHFYENFFQEPSELPGEDVSAKYGELGTSLRLSRTYPLRLYGSVNYLKYDDSELDSSNGFRVGLRSDGKPHAFDFHGDLQKDRPTFDVGDEFDRADIRTFAGEYAFRFADDWQLSVDGELQEQEFDITPERDNDFSALGGAIRYRGSRVFSPEIGYRTGARDVNDETLSYDQSDTYLQIRSSLSRVYLSLRYRMREREYTTDDIASSNFGRKDDRDQIAAAADVTLSDLLVLNLYASREETDTNLEGRDFDTSLYIAGVTFRF
ncbi:MAG: hypothetical protein ACYC7A_08555 [Thermoanaerobaculia bacterium]